MGNSGEFILRPLIKVITDVVNPTIGQSTSMTQQLEVVDFLLKHTIT